MTIDPVKIPQNVYVEDRIIGPITLRQIMIVLAGSGVSYGIWAAMKSAGTVSPIQTGIAWIPAVIAAAFAFVKINGISLFRIVLLSLERINKPAMRVWQPRRGIYINIVTKKAPKANEDIERKREMRRKTAIEELSKVLDQGPPESAFDSLTEEGADKENDTAPTEDMHDEPAKPVNKKRVQANESNGASVDDIQPKNKKKNGPRNNGGLLRDIIPPPSHA